MSPGAACKCVVCVHGCARSSPPAPSPGASFPGTPPPPRARPLPEGTPPGLPGEFHQVGGKRAGWGCPASPDPRQRPKVSAAGAAPPPSRLLPNQPELWEVGTPQRLSLGAPDIQPPTWTVSCTENHPRRWGGGGGARLSGQGAAAAQAEPRLAGRPPRELSGRGTEPGCPCDCGVLWKRKLLEVSAKASRQREPEAGVRGETWDEHGGRRLQAPGPKRSSPGSLGCPKACNCPAGGTGRSGRLEIRDLGGGTSPGEAGLEVAPRSSEGPQRMLEGDWEGRADTSSTWRTFPCTQQPQLQGIPFPP